MKDRELKEYVEAIPQMDPHLSSKIYNIYKKNEVAKASKKTKPSLKRVVAFITCFILLVSTVITVVILSNRLVYDYEMGEIAFEKASNAQYVPDLNKFVQREEASKNRKRNAKEGEETVTVDEFQELISNYSRIINYAGAGKYLGYDIFEVKEEIEFVLKNVPAFNQWFRLPHMREEEGFAAIPYYENWAYLLEMNSDRLSITRVCWSTRSRYYDFDKGVTVEDYPDGSSFIQYEVMKIDYYMDDTDNEVVECHVYSVGVDKVYPKKNKYNDNVDDYYPFEYQYLKNVKDKSMVKYHITSAERTEYGMDIRGLYPYGVRKEFTVVDYDGYKNVTKTVIDTDFADEINVDPQNIQILLDAIGYPTVDLNEISIEDLIEDMAKHIVDNDYLKNNWPEIYRESSRAKRADQIYGPHYGKEMPIEGIRMYVDVRDYDKGTVEVYISADMSLKYLEFDTKYSLSVALKNRETGELIVLDRFFIVPDDDTYEAAKKITKDFFRWGLEADYKIKSEALQITKEGVYDFVTVLEKLKIEAEDTDGVEVIDPLITGLLVSYIGLDVEPFNSSGKTYKYYISSIASRLTLTVVEMNEVSMPNEKDPDFEKPM